MKVGVIGGGAAGFFAAIQVKENYPNSTVVILEKSQKILSKVRISGGGRCNVTNASSSIAELSEAYPRGKRLMKRLLPLFSTPDIKKWFEERGVPLYDQEDGRVFPKSDNSQSIVDCLLNETQRLGISIDLKTDIKAIKPTDNGINLLVGNDNSIFFDKVIVATGGSPKISGLKWLEELGHKIEMPVPSLFTFNMPDEAIKKLMGVTINQVITRIQGEKLSANGPLLITHWGMSGPAIIVLSAFAARRLAEKNYQFNLSVNWANEENQEKVRGDINAIIQKQGNRQLHNIQPYALPSRLWEFLLEKMDQPKDKKWNELGKKGIQKLIETLCNDVYEVRGKTTFKEEFVTCGGVSLSSINQKTMESKIVPGLYFAGEVLDIDAITGGYNFQAAWTTGYVAGKLK